MKKSQLEELRKAPREELKEKSFNLRKELFNLRAKQKLGQLKNFTSLGLLRRDIARVETILSENQKSTPDLIRGKNQKEGNEKEGKKETRNR